MISSNTEFVIGTSKATSQTVKPITGGQGNTVQIKRKEREAVPDADATTARITAAILKLVETSLPRRALDGDATTARNESTTQTTSVSRRALDEDATNAGTGVDPIEIQSTDESTRGDDAYIAQLVADGRIQANSTYSTSNQMFSNTDPALKTAGMRFTNLRESSEKKPRSLEPKAAMKILLDLLVRKPLATIDCTCILYTMM